MTTCSKCGNPVEFRYIDGRPMPLHLEGGCIDDGSSWSLSGYAESEDGTCRLTACPECGAEVYFIRHNRGSVWIDPPLGWPWYKHPCMDKTLFPRISQGPRSLFAVVLDDAQVDKGSHLIIGVIKACQASSTKRTTLARFVTGDGEEWFLLLKGNGLGAVGELVVLDLNASIARGIDKPQLRFDLHGLTNSKGTFVRKGKFVQCPECRSAILHAQMMEHVSYVHGLKFK